MYLEPAGGIGEEEGSPLGGPSWWGGSGVVSSQGQEPGVFNIPESFWLGSMDLPKDGEQLIGPVLCFWSLLNKPTWNWVGPAAICSYVRHRL